MNLKGYIRRKIRDTCARLDRKKIDAQISSDKSSIPVFWANQNNFGDRLTHDILTYYDKFPILVHPINAAIFGAGSIVQILKNYPKWTGNFLGSGLIEPRKILFKKPTPKWVRGPLTADYINCPTNSFGDPGLIADTLYLDTANKNIPEFEVGFIPHYADLQIPWIIELCRNPPKGLIVINPRQSPKKVASYINSCERIASSSLHGLIFSDSLFKPSIWATCGGRVIGNDFKFRDYFASIETKKTRWRVSSVADLMSISDSAETSNAAAIRERKTQIFKLLDETINIKEKESDAE